MELFGFQLTIKELLLSAFSGFGVSLIAYFFYKRRGVSSKNNVKQEGNTVFGDQAGRDINKDKNGR